MRLGPGSGRLEGPKYNLREDTVIENLTIEKALGFAMEKQHLRQVLKYMMAPDSKMRGVSDEWT